MKVEFNIDSWYGTLLMTPEYYRHLKNYVENNESKLLHLNSITIVSVDLTKPNEIKSEEVPVYDYDSNESKKWILDDIAKAFYHYSNQMLVILSSYLELIIQEFFETLFYYHPEKMYDFISSSSQNELKGHVELKLVLNSASIDELKMKLSKRATANANKGDILRIIKKIETLCKCSFDEKLKSNLKNLVEHRNQVIHERKLFDVNEIIVDRTSDNITSLLSSLGKILFKNNIPIVNHSGLVG